MNREQDLLERENFNLRLLIFTQRLALLGMSIVLFVFLGVMLWV